MAVLLVLVAYLLGAIPSGLIVGRAGYGVDLRERGSGNIGSTNAKRVLGNLAGNLVLALDILKGLLITLVAASIVTGTYSWPPDPNPSASILIAAAGAAAIIGNVFPVYIRFQGGKGVGVGSGVLLAMVPVVVAILLPVWLAMRALTRYVSVASLLVAFLFPLLMWWRHPDNLAYIGFAIFAAALVIFSHRGNVGRLLSGEESRVGHGPGAGGEEEATDE